MKGTTRGTGRVAMQIAVEYEGAGRSRFTQDLSVSGMFVQTDAPLPVGTIRVFTLHLPDQTAWIASGEVRRTVAGKGMGVLWVFDDPRARAVWTARIEELVFEAAMSSMFKQAERGWEAPKEDHSAEIAGLFDGFKDE